MKREMSRGGETRSRDPLPLWEQPVPLKPAPGWGSPRRHRSAPRGSSPGSGPLLPSLLFPRSQLCPAVPGSGLTHAGGRLQAPVPTADEPGAGDLAKLQSWDPASPPADSSPRANPGSRRPEPLGSPQTWRGRRLAWCSWSLSSAKTSAHGPAPCQESGATHRPLAV